MSVARGKDTGGGSIHISYGMSSHYCRFATSSASIQNVERREEDNDDAKKLRQKMTMPILTHLLSGLPIFLLPPRGERNEFDLFNLLLRHSETFFSSAIHNLRIISDFLRHGSSTSALLLLFVAALLPGGAGERARNPGK